MDTSLISATLLLLSKATNQLATEDKVLERSIIDVDKRLALSNVLHDTKFDALNAKFEALLLLVTSSLPHEKAGTNQENRDAPKHEVMKEVEEKTQAPAKEEKVEAPATDESPATLIFCDLCKKKTVCTDLQLHDSKVDTGCECSECKNFLYCRECTINIYAAIKAGAFRCLSCLSKKRLECPCENTPGEIFCPGKKCKRKGCRNCFLLITSTNGITKLWYCPDCWRLTLGK